MDKAGVLRYMTNAEKTQGPCGYMIVALAPEDIETHAGAQANKEFKALSVDAQRKKLSALAAELTDMFEDREFCRMFEDLLDQHNMRD